MALNPFIVYMLQTIFKLQAHFKTAWLQTSHKCCRSYSGDVQLEPRAVSPESQAGS